MITNEVVVFNKATSGTIFYACLMVTHYPCPSPPPSLMFQADPFYIRRCLLALAEGGRDTVWLEECPTSLVILRTLFENGLSTLIEN